jgi:serine/threonine protein phosphatase PrpC
MTEIHHAVRFLGTSPEVHSLTQYASDASFVTPNKAFHRRFMRHFVYGHHSARGPRNAMEDFACVAPTLSQRCAAFGVFDGHLGIEAADHAAEHLHALIYNDSDFHLAMDALLQSTFGGTSTPLFAPPNNLFLTACAASSSSSSSTTTASENMVAYVPSTARYLCSNMYAHGSYSLAGELDMDDENDDSMLESLDVSMHDAVPATQASIDAYSTLRHCMTRAYAAEDQHLCNVMRTESGTTATTLFILDQQFVVCANVGDSRAVLFPRILSPGSTPKWLSEDHVKRGCECDLEVLRSLGDPRYGTSSEPSLFVHSLDFESDYFIVLASDGIWNHVSNEEVDKVVREALRCGGDPQQAAQQLIEYALLRRGGQDNATAIVIELSQPSRNGLYDDN